jgi:DNA-binding MarR family transcriptional regulator
VQHIDKAQEIRYDKPGTKYSKPKLSKLLKPIEHASGALWGALCYRARYESSVDMDVARMNTTDTPLETSERERCVAAIDHILRRLTWQGQKQSLHTLSRPDIALTMPQMVTLFAIRDAETCRMSELAEVTQQSAGTLTGIVDRLIDDGLVARVRDADDRRVVQVALTDVGRERIERVEQARHDAMARMVYHFGLDQLHQFEELLRLLLRGIDAPATRQASPPPSPPSHT